MIEVKNLHKAIKGQQILKGVDLSLGQGESVVLIGSSGTGKSVLLRHLIGLMRPDSGTLTFDGKEYTHLNDEELNPIRRQIGMLFQNGALFDSLSVYENLAFPLRERKEKDEKVIASKIAESLALVELSGQEQKMPSELSGGMRKRVALARAAIGGPRFMLYDEPTSGLDPVVSDSISRLIVRLRKKLNMGSLVVTHDMASAYLIADKIVYLREGVVYFSGTPDEIRSCGDPVVKNFIEGVSGIKD